MAGLQRMAAAVEAGDLAGSCRGRRCPHCGASHRRAAAGQPRGAPPAGRRDRGGGGIARGRRRARARYPAPAARRPALRARRRRSPPRGSRAARARADCPARAAHRRDRPGRRHQHGLGWQGRLARGDVRPRPAARRGPRARPPARRRRLRPSARPLPPASRRRQPWRSLRQPRPRPFRAQGRQSPAGERDPLRRGGAGERHRLRPQRGDPVRPDDLRQLLDRADLRAALAQLAALRADPARRHRPLAAVRGLGREPDLRLPEPQGLHARTRRSVSGQHPLPDRLPGLLGLRPAVPRGGGDDPRRLPPRHQGEGDRGGADRPPRAVRVPPQPAQRALARGLLQRARAPVGVLGLRDRARAHGQPRQLDHARDHPADGASARARRGRTGRGRRLLRPGPVGAVLRHPLGDRPDLARQGLHPPP